MSVTEMPDRFTPSATTVLKFAYQEAIARNHRYIGPEHLLLALVRDEERRGAPLLRALGVSGTTVRQTVEKLLARRRMSPRQLLRAWLNHRKGHDGARGLDALRLSGRARRCIALAVDEAHRRASHTIEVEHLLYGLVGEGGGLAAVALKRLGITSEQLRTRL